MRFSTLFAPTLRETPADAEIPSHQLMLRAGLMRRAAGGIYSLLPLGYRVKQKIEAIIREELDRAGCQELLLPIVQPAELWHQTGRWDDYGDEMFKLKDRYGRSFCLGPTHEEIITQVVKGDVSSYKQLPLILYQIQNKYRDEIRPRFGVMRGREFIMKDAYSFDLDEAGLRESYKKMYDAYTRIFRRLGAHTVPVQALSGQIGGDHSHEFVIPSDNGEDEIVVCRDCDYAANIDLAAVRPPDVTTQAAATGKESDSDTPPVERLHTPSIQTIEALQTFTGRPASHMIKTLIFKADGEPVVALIRGDRELNEEKLATAIQAETIEAVDHDDVEELIGAPVGFLGPVGLEGVRMIADPEVRLIDDAITGANEIDMHLNHVVYGRDYTVDEEADLRMITADDHCPECGGGLDVRRGVEVGHIFQLGTKYSASLGAVYLDKDGREREMVMGCYGIGVTRTLAALIEQYHDERGIKWPVAVAPYHVTIVVIDAKNEEQMTVAKTLYDHLWAAGIETVLDDRDERPGVKFNDNDLIGFPFRLTVGPRALAAKSVEYKRRSDGEEQLVLISEVAEMLAKEVEDGRTSYLLVDEVGETR